jgi:hypothetical protein
MRAAMVDQEQNNTMYSRNKTFPKAKRMVAECQTGSYPSPLAKPAVTARLFNHPFVRLPASARLPSVKGHGSTRPLPIIGRKNCDCTLLWKRLRTSVLIEAI